MYQLSQLQPGQSIEVGCYCVSRIIRGYLVQRIVGSLGKWYNPLGVMSLSQVSQLIGGCK